MTYIICIILALNLACQSRRPSPVGPDTNEKIQLVYQKIEAAEFEMAHHQIKELKTLNLTVDQKQNLNLAEARLLFLVGELSAADQTFQTLIIQKDLLTLDNQKILKFYLLDLYDSQGNLNAYLATLQELDSFKLNLAELFLKEAKKSVAFLQSHQLQSHQEALSKAQTFESQLLTLPSNEASRLYFEASYFNYSSWIETHYDLYLDTLNLVHQWRTQSLKIKDNNSPWSSLAFKRTFNEWQQALSWAKQPTLPAHLGEHIKSQKLKELKLARLTKLYENLIRFENLLPPLLETNQILAEADLTAYLDLKSQVQHLLAKAQESHFPTRKGPLKDLGLSPATPSSPAIKESP